MSRILSIETATDVCSVALTDNQKVLALQELYIPRSHASRLAVLIEEVFSQSDFNKNELDAVAVSMGPGSYTGLRIGVSTAKGICYALDIPLVAVNTLEAMAIRARAAYSGYNYYVPMLDARRMEVYTYVAGESGEMKEPTEAVILDEFSFRSILNKGRTLFVGDGAQKASTVLKHPNAYFISTLSPSALEVAKLALPKLREAAAEDLAGFEPYYLKDFVATKPKAS